MGCGFSRRVVPNTGNEIAGVGAVGNGIGPFMGDGGVAAALADVTGNAALKVKDSSLSFIVPIREDDDDLKNGSIIRRHPPVRLRRLEEEQQVHRPKLTLGALERRQAEAEERRRKILDSRVQSAQHFQRKLQPESSTTTSPLPPTSTNRDPHKRDQYKDQDGETKRTAETELDDRQNRDEYSS